MKRIELAQTVQSPQSNLSLERFSGGWRRVIRALFIVVIGNLNAGDFLLEARAKPAEQLPYLPVKIEYQLTNLGKDCRIPIGLDRVNCYVFAYVAFEGEEERIWIDTTVPRTGFTPSKPELYVSKGTRSGQMDLYWQPDRPMLDRPGTWTVRIVWKGPNEDVASKPLQVRIEKPVGSERIVLTKLLAADALPALHHAFVDLQDYRDSVKRWREVTSEIKAEHPNSRYHQRLSEAARSSKVDRDDRRKE